MTEKKKTGFALLTPEQRRALGRKGQASAVAQGKPGHRYTPEEAAEAGAAGGSAGVAAKRRDGKPIFAVIGPGHKFNSETGRKAIEQYHDKQAQADPEVEWVGETE